MTTTLMTLGKKVEKERKEAKRDPPHLMTNGEVKEEMMVMMMTMTNDNQMGEKAKVV